MTTYGAQPPHLIDALEQLDEQLDSTSSYRDETSDGPTVEDTTEAPARRQVGQLVEVFLEGADPYTVRITNRERIAYEKAAARHREWPPMATGQNFAMTFVCWSAARRAGLTGLTFEAFADQLDDYEVVTETAADPTQ